MKYEKLRYAIPPSSEWTPESVFKERRTLLKQMAGLGLGALGVSGLTDSARAQAADACTSLILPDVGPLTSYEAATGYNNYLEFTTDRKTVAEYAARLKLEPWTLRIGGLVEKPLELDLGYLSALCVQERIYRFRCVEGWSMVVPWQGVPLRSVLKLARPLSGARFVRFTALHRPDEMSGQQGDFLSWPYTEMLRIDEAANPLVILATGMYGKALPPQNGAPLRLVVPWKYGFKSIKALVSIDLVDAPQRNTWQIAAPTEYGFYANVNPDVPHPRWSQRDELPLGHNERRPTLKFNGYEELVASMYRGMDLSRYY